MSMTCCIFVSRYSGFLGVLSAAFLAIIIGVHIIIMNIITLVNTNIMNAIVTTS